MNDHILAAWSVGAIATLAVSAIAAELWRSRERWRNEAEHLRGCCVELRAEALKLRSLAADINAENNNLREELKRRTK